jgi:hypothetical protein
MCGIAGFVKHGEPEPVLPIIMGLLGIFMQQRGTDSWGYTDGKTIKKAVGWLEDGWQYDLGLTDSAAIHTRHATTGGITAENSHPYQFGDIIGMHNGVVYNHTELNKKYKRKLAVDSMHIFAHIADNIPTDDIEAYGAIVYWKDGLVHLGRFHDGSLTIAKTTFGWLFASTKWAIEQALRFTNTLHTLQSYIEPKEGKLYAINGGNLVKVAQLNFKKSVWDYKWDSKAGFPMIGVPASGIQLPATTDGVPDSARTIDLVGDDAWDKCHVCGDVIGVDDDWEVFKQEFLAHKGCADEYYGVLDSIEGEVTEEEEKEILQDLREDLRAEEEFLERDEEELPTEFDYIM